LAQNGIQALETQLHGPVSVAVGTLSDNDLLDLAEAIRDARHRQAAELAAAGDQAVKHIPRLLRGPVRKALG
jgi:hypothetical protein